MICYMKPPTLLEQPYGMLIYGDGKIEREFLRKTNTFTRSLVGLEDLKFRNPYSSSPEYNEELDMFLYEDLGYEKLSSMVRGLFISAYAVTSLREYFATGFVRVLYGL